MPKRLLKRLPQDHNRRRRFIVLSALGMALFAGTMWWIVTSVNDNSQRIANTPTKAQLLRVLKRERANSRRACRVANDRLSLLGQALALDSPGSDKRFPRITAALRPRNCLKAYPVPTLKDVEKGGDATPSGNHPAPP